MLASVQAVAAEARDTPPRLRPSHTCALLVPASTGVGPRLGEVFDGEWPARDTALNKVHCSDDLSVFGRLARVAVREHAAAAGGAYERSTTNVLSSGPWRLMSTIPRRHADSDSPRPHIIVSLQFGPRCATGGLWRALVFLRRQRARPHHRGTGLERTGRSDQDRARNRTHREGAIAAHRRSEHVARTAAPAQATPLATRISSSQGI